jgi:hypothetical protein
MKMTRISLFAAATSLFLSNCKAPVSASGSDSSLSSVAVSIPEAVRSKIGNSGVAILTADGGLTGSARYFTSDISFGANGGSAVIEFNKDDKGNALRINDYLGGTTLEIKAGKESAAVYSGAGSPGKITVAAGTNDISFSLKCVDTTKCNSQADLDLVPVQGVSGDSASVASAKLRITVKVDQSGQTIDQRREKVAACQKEVKKLTCDAWELRQKSAKAICERIYAADVSSATNSAWVGTDLDSLVSDCKSLGVLR